MDNVVETVDDIIKEMRECEGFWAYYDGGMRHDSGEENVIDIGYFREFADRIEAAYNAEISKLKADRNEALSIVNDIDKLASIEHQTEALMKKNKIIVELRKELDEVKTLLNQKSAHDKNS